MLIACKFSPVQVRSTPHLSSAFEDSDADDYTCAGTLTDRAEGRFASATFYDDTDVAQIESLPDTAIHRSVDLAVVEADRQGYVKTHVILPTQIFGLASGILFDEGIANRHSVALPFLIRTSLARSEAGVVNEGLARWQCVHIEDSESPRGIT